MPLLAAAACVGDSPPESATPDAATTAAEAAPAARVDDFVAGELIVRLDQPLTAGVAVDLGGHRVVPVMEIMTGTWLVRLDVDAARAARPLPELTLAAISDVERLAGVRFAHPNHVLDFSIVTPDDEHLYPQLWHYDQIRLRQAWELTTGPAVSNAVRVAVIDSGSTSHPDLQFAAGANVTVSPGDTNPQNTLTYHHGVMVAGLIGARTNNGTGTAGVCWNCAIVPIRANTVGSNGSEGINAAWAAVGVLWAAGLHGTDRSDLDERRRHQPELQRITVDV